MTISVTIFVPQGKTAKLRREHHDGRVENTQLDAGLHNTALWDACSLHLSEDESAHAGSDIDLEKV